MEICNLTIREQTPLTPQANDYEMRWYKRRECENSIKYLLRDIQSNYLKIAYYLMEMCEDDLHDGIYSYCAETFGFSKTTTFNLLTIAKTFGDDNKGLKEEYKGFGLSQLVEMSTVPQKFHKYFNSAMTIKEMRELKLGQSVYVYVDGKSLEYKIPTSELFAPSQNISSTKTDPATVTKAEVVRAAPKIIGLSNNFRNDDERKKFLDEYEKWLLWIDIPELTLKIYRTELSDGATVLAYQSEHVLEWETDKPIYHDVDYSLFKKGEKFRFKGQYNFTSQGTIVDHIRVNKLWAPWQSPNNVL